jgi:TolB protein
MRTWLILGIAYLLVVVVACGVLVAFTSSWVTAYLRDGPALAAPLPKESNLRVTAAPTTGGMTSVLADPTAFTPAPANGVAAAPSGQSTPGATPEARSGPPPGYLPGRLLILEADGNISTTRPDGTDRLPLTQDAGPSRLYRQAVWSPDAERIAWVAIDANGSEVQSALLTGRVDGSDRTRAEAESPPFYLYWSPDGERLAYLANGPAGLDLGVLQPQGGQGHGVTLDQGSPFYFSWAPDGRRMLVHVGADRLALLGIDGTVTSLQQLPGPFSAPQWSADGARLLYAVGAGGGQPRLLAAPASGEPAAAQELFRFDGALSFSLSPDGRRVAYVETRVPVGMAAYGHLFAIDANGIAGTEVYAGPVLAFWWSPDGQALLFLTLDSPDAPGSTRQAAFRPQQGDTGNRLRWHVWDGTQTRDFAPFLPSQTFFADYLRFFDQYSRSMTLWSPDSRAFVYAGSTGTEPDAIWVQRLDANARPQRVTTGSMATWSPR